MKLKSKKVSNRQFRDNLSRREMELESNLLESAFSAMDLVNPADAYLDPITGEQWIPLGFQGAIDAYTAPFLNETELTMIRQRARITALKNPYAKNLLNSITSFVVGKGHHYEVAPKKGLGDEDSKLAVLVAKRVQRFLDLILKMNKWSKRQRNIVWRFHRDGESFIRIFYQDNGTTLFRLVEPADVHTPPEETSNPSYTFGVLTEEDDVETPLKYYVGDEEVPAEEMQHRKANVDLNTKRGLTTLFTIREHLDRALKLLRNMSITVANQTAISTIRHHKATGKQVQSFAAKAANNSQYNRRTGTNTPQSFNSPGTTIDVVDGRTKYEFPANGLNAASPVQVLSAELRAIASSLSWPEFMVGSDSSNANYSSTMVAENPAVKSIQTEQADHIEDDLDLLWAAIEHAVNSGRLPPEAMTLVEIEVEPPAIVARNIKDQADTDEILNRMRVKSPQTIALENSLDYSQEQENFNSHDDTNLDGDPLSGGDDDLKPTPTTVGGQSGVADTAMNGTQIASLVSIVQQAGLGLIPPASVPAIIAAAFPNLPQSAIDAISSPLVGFKANATNLKGAA